MGIIGNGEGDPTTHIVQDHNHDRTRNSRKNWFPTFFLYNTDHIQNGKMELTEYKDSEVISQVSYYFFKIRKVGLIQMKWIKY
jgi:hypothetical protein